MNRDGPRRGSGSGRTVAVTPDHPASPWRSRPHRIAAGGADIVRPAMEVAGCGFCTNEY